jgi:capsular exopolysaccharide synthesis family protein
MADHERASEIYDRVADEMENIKANGQIAGDRVFLLQPADRPSTPDEEIPYKRIAMFAGVAFCIPFLLAVAWEHFFRRVNSRQQLEITGALKVVGEITTLPRRTRHSGSARISRDLQLFEESVDGLRTYLSLLDTLQGLRVLAVTSAISREGKTSVAAQLAVSLAAATGEPTLLIDGDLRSPDVHRVFGVDLSPGLADVLAGELSDDEAIETDFNQTLHLMTAGRLTTSPHRLLGGGEFRAMLERLRGVYRFIVIDTPPLLPASEALILSRAADAAILSARRDFSRLDQVTEAYSRLRSAGVSFAGVVLNGIPTRHYAYKYGSYGYRRQVSASE